MKYRRKIGIKKGRKKGRKISRKKERKQASKKMTKIIVESEKKQRKGSARTSYMHTHTQNRMCEKRKGNRRKKSRKATKSKYEQNVHNILQRKKEQKNRKRNDLVI